RYAMAGEIGRRNLPLFASLQVGIEAGPASFDFLLRLAAIEQVKLRGHNRGAIRVRLNNIRCHVPGAGKYGLEKLTRDFPIVNLLAAQDEKIVGAGRESALDGKNISKPQLVGFINACPCRELRPLVGIAERFK